MIFGDPIDGRRSGHDVAGLLQEWEALIQEAGWERTVIHKIGDWPVFAVENQPSASSAETMYFSAGVHGDECAPLWAMLRWARRQAQNESQTPWVVFPCLNPHGVVENTRGNEGGIDLNRSFQNREIPVVAAWQDFLAGRKFRVATSLHEDYDATGIYLYEISRSKPVGDQLLSVCEGFIERELDSEIDGAEFENGLLRHPLDEATLGDLVEEELGGGYPEAIWLYQHHARDSFTFETPSESDLAKRIATQEAFLEAVSSL